MSEVKIYKDCAEKMGYKVVCSACNGSYYDLQKEFPSCPYCHTQYSGPSKRKVKVKAQITAKEEVIFDELEEEMLDISLDPML